MEGLNNKIKVIERRCYGFHDLEHFSLKIKQVSALNCLARRVSYVYYPRLLEENPIESCHIVDKMAYDRD